MTKKQINPGKFFLSNMIGFVLYTLNPRFLIVMAAMIAVGSVVFIAPFFGMMVNLLIMAVSFKFAVDILLTTAEGDFDPKSVSFSENDYIVVVQVIVIGILLDFLTDYVLSMNNNKVAVFILYILQFIMPAIYMVLAYSRSLLEAINPLTLVRFIKPWFFTYCVFSLFYLFTIYLETQGVLAVIMNVGSFKLMYVFSLFILVFFAFLNFNIMGFLIFQNFNQADEAVETFTPGSSNPNTSDKDFETHTSVNTSSNPIYNRIQSLIAAKATKEALAIIAELQNEGDDSAELAGYKKQALQFANQKVEVPPADEIHDLIKQNKVGKAFRFLESLYAKKISYMEVSESDLGILARHAYGVQKYPVVMKLLSGFNNKYPNSNELVPNYYLVAQVLYKNPKTRSKALVILNGLVKKYPDHEMSAEIKSWIKGAELMQDK